MRSRWHVPEVKWCCDSFVFCNSLSLDRIGTATSSMGITCEDLKHCVFPEIAQPLLLNRIGNVASKVRFEC